MRKRKVCKILYYLIIYSFLGFVIETIYAIFTKGTLESRKSFLYGPFCVVYGIAAIVLIYTLKKFKHKNKTLFLFGMFLGCAVEYFSSLIGEVFLHAIWWDYSNSFLNIDGRTCLYYALLWGVLSILLINKINPLIDKLYCLILKNIKRKNMQRTLAVLSLFFIFDSAITCFAVENFLINVSNEYDIKIKGINRVDGSQFLSKHYTNEKMMMIFPNIIVITDNNETVYLETVLADVKNYYYKFGKK